MDERSRETVAKIWESVCLRMKEKSDQAYDQLMQVTPLDMDDERILLGVSDELFCDMLLKPREDMIQDFLKDITGKYLKVEFEFGHVPAQAQTETEIPEEPVEEIPPSIREDIEPHPVGDQKKVAPNCQRQNVFETFVVGEENRYAFAAAKAVAVKPGQVYNPLYIYGGPGMGKTHLIQAVANAIINSFPDYSVRYISCENFLNEYVEALSRQKYRDFCDTFRNVDLLLIDDVHQLSGKNALQEEFFNTFNTLHNAGKQIVLTSDKQPSEIKGLEDRLVSRFQMGATVEITQSSFETRLAILRQEREAYAMNVDDSVLSYIANRIRSNIRPLKGAMMRLQIYAQANNIPITMEAVTEQLNGLLEEVEEAPRVSISLIQQVVAEHFSLHIQDLTGPKRTKEIAYARMIAMYLSRKLTQEVQQQIGIQFGNRTHASVIHAYNQIEEKCMKDEAVKSMLNQL